MNKKIVIERCFECPLLIHKEYSICYESYYCRESARYVNKKKVTRESNYFPNWCKLQNNEGD